MYFFQQLKNKDVNHFVFIDYVCRFWLCMYLYKMFTTFMSTLMMWVMNISFAFTFILHFMTYITYLKPWNIHFIRYMITVNLLMDQLYFQNCNIPKTNKGARIPYQFFAFSERVNYKMNKKCQCMFRNWYILLNISKCL